MQFEVQIVSDVVCPWCYIGKKNWESAVENWAKRNPNHKIDQEWKAFRLDPTLPEEGKPREEVMQAKFGNLDRVHSLFEQVKKVANQVGIEMDFKPGVTQPNTLHAHRLIRLGKKFQIENQLAEALFAEYFIHNGNLADKDNLTRIAIENGIPEEEIQKFWDEKWGEKDTIDEEINMRSMGVTGVPFFIINEKYAFSGAQPPDVIEKILDQILVEAIT
ncbi:DsbA family oxidoreductase [Leptospira sp. GIMC2001]|uniref:DsbA family oxidoreductase n=1 Tax=Leptospira sp. GIMC2001 TaxID=1513297 RepID=UPI00234AF508|nr:DsbA family oxidoreductase [Leptospira sp. GIMC2001]WCL49851.1 DsbA family oxidoreductase [Leptospira sp. GIMC2001]